MVTFCTFLLIFGIFTTTLAAAESSVDVDPNTKLLLIGIRHGNRNPCDLFKDDPNEGNWAQEGLCQLTNVGKSQAYALGLSLRERYGESGLLPEFPSPEEIKGISSNSERTQQTLQMAFAGAFPPIEDTFSDWDDEFSPSVHWQPVAYAIDNSIVKMSSVKNCPAQVEAYKPVKSGDLPFMQETFRENHDLFQYIEENTGWNLTGSSLGDIGDIVFNMKLYEQPLPEWIENPTLEGWEGGSLYEKLKSFQEFNQRACARFYSCARMFSGSWLKHMIDQLNKKKDGESEDLKAIFYASHSRYTLSAMRMMFMDYDELQTSGGFILEYRDMPEPSIRLLHHAPTEEDFASGRHLEVAKLMDDAKCKEAADSDNGWCPLDTFIDSIKGNSFDYKEECGLTDKDDEKKGTVILEADCTKVVDKMKQCKTWIGRFPNYCDRDDAKFVFCRKTCLCDKINAGSN